VAIRDILQLGDPRLRHAAPPVLEPDGPESGRLAGNLKDTLLAHRARTGYGRGIAAPQLGVSSRIIHVELLGLRTLINPRISARSEQTMVVWDFCFSYFSIVFPVERATLVEVKYLDPMGREQTLEATGHLSELLQHEIDHLDGVLAIDRVSDVRRICAFREWEKRHAAENDRIVADAVRSLRRS
jgi:peptide deformylase